MTDQEIIKGLECLKGDKVRCSSCEYYSRGFVTCWQTAGQDAIDLINRQKAKITKQKERCSKCGEKTTKTILNLQELLGEQKAEIERLKRLREQEERSTNLLAKKCYKDGVKEFAERLRKEICERPTLSMEQDRIVLRHIDNLVKEMESDHTKTPRLWEICLDEAGYEYGICPACGFEEREHFPTCYTPKYCPECGTKIDGRSDE